MTRTKTWGRGAVLFVVAAVVLLTAPVGSSSTRWTTPLTGSVTTNKLWNCDGPVALDSLSVTIAAGSSGSNDAVHLRSGCTGHIDKITIVQYRGDGIKIQRGVHDLVVGGGSIRCYGHDAGKHQDGIQAFSGERITFQNLDDQCESANNAALFFQHPFDSPPPTDIVCDGCKLKGGVITVRVYDSVRCGIRNSTVVAGKYRAFATSGSTVDPVNVSNTFLPFGSSLP